MFSQHQLDADLCHNRISISAETTPRSQVNDMSQFKRDYVMNPICGR